MDDARLACETYVPVDISEEITRRVADELVAEYPGLRVARASSATSSSTSSGSRVEEPAA